jgi:hypothetical protein
VFSDGGSAAVSFCNFSSTAVEAEGRGIVAKFSIEPSSSLRTKTWIQQKMNKTEEIIKMRRKNLQVSFKEVEQRCRRILGN